uniref:Protein-tyrosine-phosphatase n=1 Tax=Macrostomum lignano TaxID=282301 RepID=A0A1I8IVZ4_9PLAT
FEIPTYQPGPPQRVAQFPNGTLRIAEVQLADKNFLCSVEGGRSATLNLNIHRPAEVQPFAEPRIELPAGSNSSISCIVKGDRPFNIEWFGQYQAVEDVRTSLTGPYGRTVSWHSGGTTAQILVSGTGGDTLRLINVNQGLRGEYTCRASNQYSRSGDPPSEQHFDVVVVEPPSKVKSLQITDRGHESLTLQWEAPDSNGQKPVIRYRVEYSDRGANGNLVSLNVSAQDRKRRVTGLQPGFNYEFAVSAVNKVGAGPPARCTGSTREQAPSGPVRELRVRAIGSAGLELVWNEPDLMLRNGFITNYTVQFRELAAGGGANCPEDAAASAAGFVTALRCRSQRAVIGVGDSMAQCRNGSLALRAFTDYEVRVTPANAVGPGPPACAVARTLEATPRSPPTNLRCEAKNQTEIFVSWGWPPHESVNGGIQQYHVQYMPAQSFRNEDESQAKEEDTDGRTRHLTIRGLLPHTEYAITVFVSNSRGRSPRILPPKFCTTLPAPPEPPKKLRALGAGASSAVIAWSQTERPNGRLLAYEVSVQPLNRSAPPADRPLLIRRNVTDWPGRHYERLTVRDLRPGGIYEVRVRGLSQGGGVGDFSEPATLAVTEKPPPRIVSFAKTFRVDRGSDVLLDCETVGGAGSQQPIWDFPQVDSSHERLANGSLLIKDVQRDGEFKCKTGQGSDADFIVYSVKAFTIPPAPRLLPGRRTSSSLELLWRTGGGRPAGAPPEAAIRQFDLRFSRGAGPQEQRQLSGGNRSYLLDRVDCGASVEFKLRAVNGFDLKSDFAAPLRISALGSAPVAASDASRWLLAHQRRHSVELNFSALLPGDDCPPDRYFVSLRPASGSEGRGFVGQVSRADLSGPSGCCYNLTEALQPGQAYQLTVTAANAAGNSTPVTRRFTASDFGGGGSGDGGSGQDFGKDNTELPTRTSGDGDWSMMFIVVVIVAVVVLVIVVLSIIGCSVLGVSCFACLCCGEAADSSEAVTSPAAASAPASQPFLLEDPPPGISGGLPEVGIAAVKGGRKVTLQVAGGKALPVPPSGAVQQLQRPADCEDDRASIDSEGNLAYYASYNPGDPAAAALAAAAAAGATLRTGSVGHVPTSTRRLQQLRQQRRRDATEARQARDYQGVPTAAQLEQRRSHMSSSTTVSSSRDELSDAYRVGKLRSGFPPGAAAAVAEYEGDGSHSGGSSGGSTDPGILQFTCRPPGPNELRKFTCEVPQSASRRYRRQLSAGTERTYESIDDSRLHRAAAAAAVEDEEEEDEEEDRQQSRQLLEPSVTPSRRLQQPPPAAAADPADPESSDPAYEEFFTEVVIRVNALLLLLAAGQPGCFTESQFASTCEPPVRVASGSQGVRGCFRPDLPQPTGAAAGESVTWDAAVCERRPTDCGDFAACPGAAASCPATSLSIRAGVGVKSFDLVDSPSRSNDSAVRGAPSSASLLPDLFRASAIDQLPTIAPKLTFKEAVVQLSVAASVVVKVTFDLSASPHELNRTNWFSRDRLKASWPVTDLASRTFDHFSIGGHVKGTFERRWFINYAYGGCSSDRGLMMALDITDSCSASWGNGSVTSPPQLVYSTQPTRAAVCRARLVGHSSDWLFISSWSRSGHTCADQPLLERGRGLVPALGGRATVQAQYEALARQLRELHGLAEVQQQHRVQAAVANQRQGVDWATFGRCRFNSWAEVGQAEEHQVVRLDVGVQQAGPMERADQVQQLQADVQQGAGAVAGLDQHAGLLEGVHADGVAQTGPAVGQVGPALSGQALVGQTDEEKLLQQRRALPLQHLAEARPSGTQMVCVADKSMVVWFGAPPAPPSSSSSTLSSSSSNSPKMLKPQAAARPATVADIVELAAAADLMPKAARVSSSSSAAGGGFASAPAAVSGLSSSIRVRRQLLEGLSRRRLTDDGRRRPRAADESLAREAAAAAANREALVVEPCSLVFSMEACEFASTECCCCCCCCSAAASGAAGSAPLLPPTPPLAEDAPELRSNSEPRTGGCLCGIRGFLSILHILLPLLLLLRHQALVAENFKSWLRLLLLLQRCGRLCRLASSLIFINQHGLHLARIARRRGVAKQRVQLLEGLLGVDAGRLLGGAHRRSRVRMRWMLLLLLLLLLLLAMLIYLLLLLLHLAPQLFNLGIALFQIVLDSFGPQLREQRASLSERSRLASSVARARRCSNSAIRCSSCSRQRTRASFEAASLRHWAADSRSASDCCCSTEAWSREWSRD